MLLLHEFIRNFAVISLHSSLIIYNSSLFNMDKQLRYTRIIAQLEVLLSKCENTEARMCTTIALLHNKIDYFFWTGFYFIHDNRLIVKMYQGAVACMELRSNTGVCWAGVNQRRTIVVPDVANFEGHIACDSRSRSEIVVPFINPHGALLGVLDVDSDRPAAFDEVDALNLERILGMIFTVPYIKPDNLM